jgi:hypothetical protein
MYMGIADIYIFIYMSANLKLARDRARLRQVNGPWNSRQRNRSSAATAIDGPRILCFVGVFHNREKEESCISS